ncbi:hypothetical protein RR46_11201 [Papilio xuthus]|uniref:Uncharacterized protein n=1 Tax=Papilio xuthus TaxID=66420 RepID=A0A194Q3U7_PAPXU|nr:hypothetical protein RR46_11201 [Papilio xuthus]
MVKDTDFRSRVPSARRQSPVVAPPEPAAPLPPLPASRTQSQRPAMTTVVECTNKLRWLDETIILYQIQQHPLLKFII